MTCHSIQVSFDGTVSETDAESAIDTVLTEYATVVDGQASPSEEDNVTVRNTALDGSGTDYHYCLYRFDGDCQLSAICTDIENELANVGADWHQVETHECYHDEAGGGACGSWSVHCSDGTVPEGV